MGGSGTYAVSAMLIMQDDYTFDQKLAEAWGNYLTYRVSEGLYMVIKEYNRTDDKLDEVDQTLTLLKEQKYLGFAIIGDGDEKPEEIEDLAGE